MHGVCPNCGYCPACGRKNTTPFQPYVTPYQPSPWQPYRPGPFWQIPGGTVTIKQQPDVYIGDPPNSGGYTNIGGGSIKVNGTITSRI